MTDNELKLLKYLIGCFQMRKISANKPDTYLTYLNVLNTLEFPDDCRTHGDSLSKHAMAGLAEWLHNNQFPAITGVIVNKNGERTNMPSKGYFEYHGRQDYDFSWLTQQIQSGCEFDWVSNLKRLGIELDESVSLPEEVPETLKEGAKKTIFVNAYERNIVARNACIKHHGVSCSVCSFDFKSFYGDIGTDFIHVHHLTPLSGICEEYEVDPIQDLIPVCPNCHAMLHKEGCISVKELKEKIEFQKVLDKG